MENSSGMGKAAVIPTEISGWNWGAFLLNWIWGVGNSTFIALLMFVPFVNIVMPFVLGFKGNAWAWRNRTWENVEHFKSVQRKWAKWAVIFYIAWFIFMGVMMFSVFSLFSQSEVVQTAVKRLESNPEVVEVIGLPLTTGFPMGSFNVTEMDGEAEVTFSVDGPKGEGTVYLKAFKEHGKWTYDEFVLRQEGVEREIDLK